MSRKLNKQTKGVAKVFYPWFSVKTRISFEAKNVFDVKLGPMTIFRREMCFLFILVVFFVLYSLDLHHQRIWYGTRHSHCSTYLPLMIQQQIGTERSELLTFYQYFAYWKDQK